MLRLARMLRLEDKDPDYPPLLREISRRPEAIYLEGALPPRTMPAIAIVGTRKATAAGRAFARKLGRDLGMAGLCVVSGLAFGIDAAAHEGALDADGRTIAVLGCGVDQICPRSNTSLARRILARGALISEYPPASRIYPQNFLARNRIISGLSLGIVIVEAPEHSGALATASFALEQGREVFVAPGPAGHPNYAGSHDLLRNGASLAESAKDIFLALDLQVAAPELGPEEQAVLNILRERARPLCIDEIAGAATLSASGASKAVSLLLIRGDVVESGGRYVLPK